MRIQILILGFRGLNLVQLNLSTMATLGTEEGGHCRGVAISGCLTVVIFNQKYDDSCLVSGNKPCETGQKL